MPSRTILSRDSIPFDANPKANAGRAATKTTVAAKAAAPVETKAKGWAPPDASQRSTGPTPLPPARLNAEQKKLLGDMSEQGKLNFQKSLAWEQLVTDVLGADAKANGGKLSAKGLALMREVNSSLDFFGSAKAHQLVRDLASAPPKAGAKGLEALDTHGPVGQGVGSRANNWATRLQNLISELEARQRETSQRPGGSVRGMADFWKQLIQSIR